MTLGTSSTGQLVIVGCIKSVPRRHPCGKMCVETICDASCFRAEAGQKKLQVLARVRPLLATWQLKHARLPFNLVNDCCFPILRSVWQDLQVCPRWAVAPRKVATGSHLWCALPVRRKKTRNQDQFFGFSREPVLEITLRARLGPGLPCRSSA